MDNSTIIVISNWYGLAFYLIGGSVFLWYAWRERKTAKQARAVYLIMQRNAEELADEGKRWRERREEIEDRINESIEKAVREKHAGCFCPVCNPTEGETPCSHPIEAQRGNSSGGHSCGLCGSKLDPRAAHNDNPDALCNCPACR